MVRPRPATFDKKKVVAENRRARFDYAVESTYEAGIALTGTEVKSLRFGEGSIAESYAEVHRHPLLRIGSMASLRRRQQVQERRVGGVMLGSGVRTSSRM